MSTHPMIEHSLGLLDEMLSQIVGVSGPDFVSRARQSIGELPDDLSDELESLLRQRDELDSQPDTGQQQAGDFCFACGRLHEKLRAYQQVQMELETTLMGPESISPASLQSASPDRLARFIDARNRLFRKVADATLKFLLIGLGLLTLGLILGLV